MKLPHLHHDPDWYIVGVWAYHACIRCDAVKIERTAYGIYGPVASGWHVLTRDRHGREMFGWWRRGTGLVKPDRSGDKPPRPPAGPGGASLPATPAEDTTAVPEAERSRVIVWQAGDDPALLPDAVALEEFRDLYEAALRKERVLLGGTAYVPIIELHQMRKAVDAMRQERDVLKEGPSQQSYEEALLRPAASDEPERHAVLDPPLDATPLTDNAPDRRAAREAIFSGKPVRLFGRDYVPAQANSSTMSVPDTQLPVYRMSAARRAGYCAALLDDEAECQRRIGHLSWPGDTAVPHMTRGPYGTGDPVEYDDQSQQL